MEDCLSPVAPGVLVGGGLAEQSLAGGEPRVGEPLGDLPAVK